MIDKSRVAAAADSKKITVYLAEEQQFLRETYRSCLTAQSGLEMVGVSASPNIDSLAESISTLKPTVVILGVRVLQPDGVKILEMIRESYPEVAILLLASHYDEHGIKALREFSRGASNGYAYLLKHTIDTVEQLTGVIFSVSRGQITIDGPVMDKLIAIRDSRVVLSSEFGPHQVDVLTRMATTYQANRYRS